MIGHSQNRKPLVQEGFLQRGAVGAKRGAIAGAAGGAILGGLTRGLPGAVGGAIGGAATGGVGGGAVNAVMGNDENEGTTEVVVNGRRILVPASHAKEMLATYGAGENEEEDAENPGTMDVIKGATAGYMRPLNPLKQITPLQGGIERLKNAFDGAKIAAQPPTLGGELSKGLGSLGDVAKDTAAKALPNLANAGSGIAGLGSNVVQGAAKAGGAIGSAAGGVGGVLTKALQAAPGGAGGAALIGAGLLGAGALGAHMLSKKKENNAESEEAGSKKFMKKETKKKVQEGVIGGTFKGMAKGAAGGAIGGATIGALGGALTGNPLGVLAGATGGAMAGALPGAAIGAPVGAITDKDENEEDACHKIVISGSDNDIQGAVQCTKHELDVLMNLVQNREKRRTKGDLLGKLQEDEEAKASLSPAQKKIAAMAPPHDKITGADFAAMKRVKENTSIKSFIKSLSQKNYAEANKYLKDIVDSKIKSKIESVRNDKIF
jgi:hypothetical protein